MPSNFKRDFKQEYKALLKPSESFLFFFKKTLRVCLHCNRKRCQHLKEIINAAAVSCKQSKIYPQLPSFTFNIADIFEFLKPLTKGAYGQVFLIKHKPTQQLMVAKVLSFAEAFTQPGKEVLESYLQERRILLQCKHPNLIKLYYSFRSEYFIYQVCTYVVG